MVAIALKSEVIFAVVGVGSVVVIICVAAALCYICQRRSRKSKGEAGGKQVGIKGASRLHLVFISVTWIHTLDIALTDLPARTRSKRNENGHAEEGVPKKTVPPMQETKREPSAPLPLIEPPALPPKSAPPRSQRRVSQSARSDPQLTQQTFSTFESFYRAQSQTTRSVPSSPHSPSGAAWPSQPTARRASTSSRRASRDRDTNAALADVALPPSSTPRKLSMTGAWTETSQKPDRASLPTSAPPQRSRPLRRMPESAHPPAAASPRAQTFSAREGPQSPRAFPSTSTAARRSSAGGSALASRPRSRSVGSSTVPPPGYHELRRVGQKQVPSVARSRSAVSRSLDGGSRPVGGPPTRPSRSMSRSASASASNAPRHPLVVGRGQPRSYFDD